MSDKYYFYDPKHGNCLRVLYKNDKNTYIINGGYGNDEGKKGYWAAILHKKSNFQYKEDTYNCSIDFSMKKRKNHKNIYHAYWSDRKIKWQDGNTWIQLYF
jgi:hypothetical protein